MFDASCSEVTTVAVGVLKVLANSCVLLCCHYLVRVFCLIDVVLISSLADPMPPKLKA